nr:PAC2 family protein [Leucobacter exalbidus]
MAAFQGWGDAGEAATDTLQHLSLRLEAEPLHSIGASGYIDFQAHRPKLTRDALGKRSLEWPETRLYGPVVRPGLIAMPAAAPAAPHTPGPVPGPGPVSVPAAEPAQAADAAALADTADTDEKDAPELPERVTRIDGSLVTELYLLAGYEPAYNWQDFADEIVDLAETWAFDTVILIGSMYAEAPHSRQIATTISSENETLRATAGAVISTYEGPVGIASIIELALCDADIPTLSLWAQVPHYVHSAPSPKATLALLDKLEELLDVVIPRGELLDQSNEWERHINRIAEGDEEMSQYIRTLERARDEALAAGTTGDAIALEFEKLLGGAIEDPDQSSAPRFPRGPEAQDPELPRDPDQM